MGWTCVLFASREEARIAGDGAVRAGSVWPLSAERLENWRDILSPAYWSQHATSRSPYLVKLPDGTEFCVDAKVSNGDHGWTVTGDAPAFTVSPSINIVGSYHGWLRDGVISDDCEGRGFPNAQQARRATLTPEEPRHE